MSDNESDEKWGTTKCKKFSGVYTEYSEWKEKFEALAEIKGYARFYEKDISTVTKDEAEKGVKEDDGSTVTKKEKNEQKFKQKAWAFLIMHLTGTAFSIVNEKKPDTYEGMMALDDKYDVSLQGVTESLKEVTTQWQDNKLTVEVDPDEYFTEITKINKKFKAIKPEYEKDEDMIVAHVTTNLPEEYKAFKLQISVRENLTLKDLKKFMRFHWYSELGGREILMGESESNEKVELALNTEQKTKRFNGTCNICGKKGHMAKDCWHNKNNGNEKTDGIGKSRWTRSKGKCNHCGKVGHKEANCWEKFPE